MATIAKMSSGASASAAIAYALGKERPLKNDTKHWMQAHSLERPTGFLKDARAVAIGGSNGIDPEIANTQFKAVRHVFRQTQARNQVKKLVQSFADDELTALNPQDWRKANDLGVELAQKLYPDYQAAVYTHIDGHQHHLHNHIIINKVNLKTGKKLSESNRDSIIQARAINDKISQREGWQVLAPVHDHLSQTERDLTQKRAYSYMNDLRGRINQVMSKPSVRNFKAFSADLEGSGVIVHEHGKNLTYAFSDASGKQRKARGTRLGKDYEKEVIFNELENRTRQEADRNRQIERLRECTEAAKQKQRGLRKRISDLKAGLQKLADQISDLTKQVQQFAENLKQRANERVMDQAADNFFAKFNAFKQQKAKTKQEEVKKVQPKRSARTVYLDQEGQELEL